MKKRIILFGIGKAYENFMERLEINSDVAEIVALADNDVVKQGAMKDGHIVSSSAEAIKIPYDCILILGRFAGAIAMQLRDMGVKEERIATECETERYIQWFRPKFLQVFCSEKVLADKISTQKRRPVALFGSLIYAGGPLALLRMAQILKKNGYDVVVVVGDDGPARKEYIRSDIPIVFDTNAFRGVFFESSWLAQCAAIVLNGVQIAPIINKLPNTVPIIWWLHDPEEYYHSVPVLYENLSLKNVDVYAVSELAWRPLEKRFPDLQKQLLLYGIPEMKIKTKGCLGGKLVFAVLGKVQSIKGQDIFLEAVSLMHEDKRNQCEFWVVGNRETKFAVDLEKKATKYENFKILGEFDRAGMNELFAKISVVVTPSRADMMPTANVEAMLHGIPCIISENAGTALFITGGEDGLIVKSNDAQDLAEKMEWMVDNRSLLAIMGKKSHAIFERNFTMKVFERNVLAIMEKNIGKPVCC